MSAENFGRVWKDSEGNWFVDLADGVEPFGKDEAKARAFAAGNVVFFNPSPSREVEDLERTYNDLLQHGYSLGCVLTRGVYGQLQEAKKQGDDW